LPVAARHDEVDKIIQFLPKHSSERQETLDSMLELKSLSAKLK
jgi:hypothetical protein